jgi:hypothetical protein
MPNIITEMTLALWQSSSMLASYTGDPGTIIACGYTLIGKNLPFSQCNVLI